MSHSRTSPKVAQGRPRSPGEVGRRSPGKRTSPVGGASPGRPCLGGQAKGPSQDQLGDLSTRQLALFSGPPAEPRSGALDGGGQAGGAETSSHRGHRIVRRDGTWIYADNERPVSADPYRDCGHCGRAATAEGHDGCLGTLPGVANACCGHGAENDAYLVRDDGDRLQGIHAVAELAWLRGYDCVWYWHRPHKGAPHYSPPRRGRRCRVRCRGRGGGPLNVAVEMADGELVVAPRWAVRRVR
jgi:hypothetical protein